MVVLFRDGFESNNFTAWTGTTNVPTVSSIYAHHGIYSMKVSRSATGGVRAYKTLGAAYSEIYMRTYVRFEDAFTTGWHGAGPRASGTANTVALHYALVDFPNQKWGIRNATIATNVWETGTSAIVADTWYCIETYMKIDAATGILRVWVNGVLKVDSTGANTGIVLIDTVSANVFINTAEPVTRDIYFDCFVASDAYIGSERRFLPLTRNMNPCFTSRTLQHM